MKKLIVITLLMVGMTIVAQERNRKQHGNEIEQFTPEQRSQLQLKKLTLELDLNESQQKEMNVFIADMNSKREVHRTAMKLMKEKGTKPTNDERFAIKIKMLDEQIAAKKRVEKILNPKQYEKWSKLREKHQGDRKGKHQGKRQEKQQRRGKK